MRRFPLVAAVASISLAAAGCSSAGLDTEASASPVRRDVPPTGSLQSAPEAWGPVEAATAANQGRTWGIVVYVHATNVVAGASYVGAVQAAEAAAQARAAAALRVSVPRSAPRSAKPTPSAGGVGDCTGFAIPDYIIQRESGGNPNAHNPSGAHGCSQTLLSHYSRGQCQGLDPYTVDGQRECTRILSNDGTNLAPWAATR